MDKNILEAHWPVLVYRVVRQTLRENPWNAIDAGQLRFSPVVKRENLRSWIGHPARGLLYEILVIPCGPRSGGEWSRAQNEADHQHGPAFRSGQQADTYQCSYRGLCQRARVDPRIDLLCRRIDRCRRSLRLPERPVNSAEQSLRDLSAIGQRYS